MIKPVPVVICFPSLSFPSYICLRAVEPAVTTFLSTRGGNRRTMEPVLQVALDHMHLKRALLAAKEAATGGADWVEAGTPLIKSEGIEAVRQLKAAVPGKTIVADLKTMDTGPFQVGMAAKAGCAR